MRPNIVRARDRADYARRQRTGSYRNSDEVFEAIERLNRPEREAPPTPLQLARELATRTRTGDLLNALIADRGETEGVAEYMKRAKLSDGNGQARVAKNAGYLTSREARRDARKQAHRQAKLRAAAKRPERPQHTPKKAAPILDFTKVPV